ncbi:MAG: SpoIIE family protein phosphatase [Stomatobaculum sp.]|nr:SpoIIE family protein phosphatase [Stomatobaculum sp.]
MSQERKRRRIGLEMKLNILLIVSIILISAGLVLITYRVYCRKVDSIYLEQVERTASATAEQGSLPYGYVKLFRERFDSDEFREVHQKAVEADDEKIIEDWMRQQPPVYYMQEQLEEQGDEWDEETREQYTLLGNYESCADLLDSYRYSFNVKDVYLQYVSDGVTYNLVDPDESLMTIGTPEEPIDAFSQYMGNDRIPPTIYQYNGQWLCTACEPVINDLTGEEIIAQMSVDLDMNDVFRERRWFLLNSAALIAVITLVVMVSSVLLTRRLATDPLKLLSKGAMGFAKGDAGVSEDDVIQLPIRSNDEIGDLYHEIQSMQQRIVESTDRMTKMTAERERAYTELRMAAQIQSSMLPGKFPPFPDRSEFDLFASMDPAKAVGGDFYDFFMIDEDHLCLVIADVSDKGVPAALFMMSAKILLNYRAQMGGSPGEILTAVNAQISKNNDSKMFVTVWIGILDVNTGVLTCSNAGHEYPAIRGQDGVFRIFKDTHGIPVAIRRKIEYRDYELLLEPGDAIFVYTDGVPEAENASGEMYGMERLKNALNRTEGQSPEGILQAVRSDVDTFVDGANQFDDLTMLCLEYRGKQSD